MKVKLNETINLTSKKIKKTKKTFVLDVQGESKVQKLKLQENGPALGEKLLEQKDREIAISLFGDAAAPLTIPDTVTQSVEPEHLFSKYEEVKSDNLETAPEEKCDSTDEDILEKKRKPAWTDKDDDSIKIYERTSNLLLDKKMKDNSKRKRISLAEVLRDNFTEIYGLEPEWAKLGHISKKDDSDMSKKVQQCLATNNATGHIPHKTLNYQVLDVFNKDVYERYALINSIEFSECVPVALVAGCRHGSKYDGFATLYQVDGEENHKIQTIKFPQFPINCARFLRDGKRFLTGSTLHGYSYVYDMEAGSKQQLRVSWYGRNLEMVMKKFEVSPDGNFLVFFGNRGSMDIFDVKSLTHIKTLEVSTNVNSLTFNSSSTQMFSFGDDGQIYVFDMNSLSCCHKFYDAGCVEGTAIAMSPNSRFLACGSRSGIVNVYDTANLDGYNPPPLKALDNLVTSIGDVKFNSTSELLAISSSDHNSAVRMIHMSTLTMFENFPNNAKVFKKQVGSVSFSPRSGYLALANNKGDARLIRLEHYKSY